MIERLLVAGDTHGDGNHIRHLLATAKRNACEAVFVLGDFGYWEHTQQGVEFLDNINRHSVTEDVPIYFLDGNHDKTSLLLDRYADQTDDEGFLLVRPNVRYARRGQRWTWAGTRFIALGGAYSVDKAWRLDLEHKRGKPESLWFPEEEMTDADMDVILADGSPVDVILAHDKPRTSNPAWNRKDFVECLPNQDRLQAAVVVLRPLLFLHGHLHYRYSDQIQMAGNVWCEVEAFTPNPEAAELGYRREDSRAVLHVAERRVEEVP